MLDDHSEWKGLHVALLHNAIQDTQLRYKSTKILEHLHSVDQFILDYEGSVDFLISFMSIVSPHGEDSLLNCSTRQNARLLSFSVLPKYTGS